MPEPQRSSGDRRRDQGVSLTSPSRGAGRPDDPAGAVPIQDVEAFYDQAPCGYLSYAPDGLVAGVNQTFLDWTGYAREALVGRRRFVDLLTPGGRIYHETHYAPLLRMQGAVQEIAFTMLRADGTRLPVLVNARLVPTEGGELGLVLASIFNATERLRYERELLAARRQAEDVSGRLALMQQVAAELAGAGDVSEVAAVLTSAAENGVGASSSCLWVKRPVRLVPAQGRDAASRRGAVVRDLPLDGVPGELATQAPGSLLVLPGSEAGSRLSWVTDVLPADEPSLVVLVPLLEHGRMLALLGCRFGRTSQLSGSQHELMVTLSSLAGLALPRARLFEQQQDVAETLQRSLLPLALPEDPRFELTAEYRPSRDGPAIGGDWYDAFRVDPARVAVVVGDVVGRGVHAAAVMGQLRSATRALASASPDPVHVLHGLDQFVDAVPAAGSATVVYAVHDLGNGSLRYACAGHPPPVVLRASGRAELLWEGRSVPLGIHVPGHERREAKDALAPGERLLMYTDGLVERRDTALDVRIDTLAEQVERMAALAPADLVKSVTDVMLGSGGTSDDVCVLCLSVPGRR